MDHILALIGRAHQGDKEARDTLVEEAVRITFPEGIVILMETRD